MRLSCFLLAACGILFPAAVSAQASSSPEPVEAWYELTARGRTEFVRAREVRVDSRRGRSTVTAGEQRFEVDGDADIRLIFWGVYDPNQPRPGAGQKPRPRGEGDSSSSQLVVVGDEGGVFISTSETRTNSDGSTTTTTTTTNTSGPQSDGSTTTTTTTESTTTPAPK